MAVLLLTTSPCLGAHPARSVRGGPGQRGGVGHTPLVRRHRARMSSTGGVHPGELSKVCDISKEPRWNVSSRVPYYSSRSLPEDLKGIVGRCLGRPSRTTP